MPILAAEAEGGRSTLYVVGGLCCLVVLAVIGLVIWLIVRAARRPAKPPTPYAGAPTAPPVPPAPAGTVNVADQLQRLAGLRDSGVITEEEFQAQKVKLLGS